MTIGVALVACGVENATPVWPLHVEVAGSVIDLSTPSMVRLGMSLGSSHASIDALLATSKQGDVDKLALEGHMVNDEAVKLKRSANFLASFL